MGIRVTNILVIILRLRSSLYTTIRKRFLLVFLGGKKQRRILRVSPFESAILCHWMMLVIV